MSDEAAAKRQRLFAAGRGHRRAADEGPALTLPVIIAWALAWRFRRLYAIAVALLAAIVAIALTTDSAFRGLLGGLAMMALLRWRP
jgi:predicted benzoate:H+ symporter BenE